MSKKFGKPIGKFSRAEPKNAPLSVPCGPIEVTLTNDGLLIECGNGFKYASFGGTKIVRPRIFGETTNRKDAEAWLRHKYPPGDYKESSTINEILKHQASFFEYRLDSALKGLASHGCLHFLFNQYDLTKNIETQEKTGSLNQQDCRIWNSECSYMRRALKFICERIVLLNPQYDSDAPAELLPQLYDDALICAEQLVKLSMASDQAHYIFPDQAVYTIFPERSDVYWEFRPIDPALGEPLSTDLLARIARDAQTREGMIAETAFDQDWQKHDDIIGDAFQKVTGVRYLKALQTLAIIPKMCSPGVFGCCSISKERLIVSAARNTGVDPVAVRKIFSGFCLTAENMANEARHFWNPKITYRAYRRGMFEIPDNDSVQLTWSDSMYKECWFMLLISIAYGILPPEWNSPELLSAVGRLSLECGRWFEKVVIEQIKTLGLEAIGSRRAFGQGNFRIECSEGEIDFLAYSPTERILIIGECKMTMAGAEPKFFRDELQDFVRKEKSYANKFRKKVQWASSNLQALSAALDSSKEFRSAITPVRIVPVMVTFLPSIASYFINDFPCVSLSEFKSAYRTAGGWPY